MTRIYRQGDVLFIETSTIPKSASESSDHILVRGETTGHAHRASQQLQVFREANNIYLQGTGQITHEEHNSLELPNGTFQVLRQQEYNPRTNQVVQD